MTDTRDPTPITSEWRGWPRYQCRLCPFDTLDEQQFVAHFAGAHPPLQVIEGVNAPFTPDPVPTPIHVFTDAPLATLKRAELDAVAVDEGVEEPEALPNKGEVIEAIKTTRKKGA